MRLTSFTDFGLRALMRLAADPTRAYSTAELADEFALSRNHLTKIMTRLSKAGIVSTRRGGGGGVMLASAADAIRLGEIVRVLEADQCLVECLSSSGGECSISASCKLKTRLRAAERAFHAELDRSTLADIALAAAAESEIA